MYIVNRRLETTNVQSEPQLLRYPDNSSEPVARSYPSEDSEPKSVRFTTDWSALGRAAIGDAAILERWWVLIGSRGSTPLPSATAIR